MDFKIKTEQFEGPLDLLLSLIEKRKLFINEISLAQITDDYIGHIQNLQNFPLADSAQFILVASTLVLIKSRSLLPSLPLTEEEESSIGNLEERLRIYKQIRDLSINVKNKFGKEIIFATQGKKREPIFSPDEETKTGILLSAIKDLIKNIPKKEIIPKGLVRKVISLEETIQNLTERIKTNLKMSFREFAKIGKEEKVNVIVSFLAMLELVKQGIVSVSQGRDFDDITIETNEVGTPKYF